MGNQGRKLKREKQKKKKKEEKKVFRCPICRSDGFLRPHPELGVRIGEVTIPVLALYEALSVVKCADCGVLYDPYVKEAREQAVNLAEMVQEAAEEEKKAKEKEKSAMTQEDFETLREKYGNLMP